MAATSTMFMNWKVPTRIYQKDAKTSRIKGGYNELTDRVKIAELAQKLPPAYLVRRTHDPTSTTHVTPRPGEIRQLREREIEEQVIREVYAKEKNKGSKKQREATNLPAMPLLSSMLNVKQTNGRSRDVSVMPLQNQAVNILERIRGEITQDDKNYINNKYNKRPDKDTAKVVTKWLETATPRDRALAVEFFSSLAGKKLLGGDQAKQEGASSPGGCKVCDGTRMKDVLNALQTGRQVSQRDSQGLRPGESNRRRLRLLSPTTRRNKQELQSWHHLPTFEHTGPVSSTTALLTRPHHPARRHFIIHPEWE